jgi:arylsulfatase
VRELGELFWAEAAKYEVLPLLGGLAIAWIRPPESSEPLRFTYYPGVENVAAGMIPPVYNRSHSISADLEVERPWCLWSLCWGTEGVIVANASFLGGFALYVEGGQLRYTYSFLGLKLDTLVASEALPGGRVNVRYEFTADEPGKMGTGGTGRLFVGGRQVAEGKLEHTVPLRFSAYAGMDVGRDNGLPVSPGAYYYLRAPFPFRGAVERVEFELR